MKMKGVKTILVTGAMMAATSAFADSPLFQFTGNGHWYQRFDTSMSWHTGKDFCASQNGHLVTATSKPENDFIFTNLAFQSPNIAWLGGTDEKKEGVWRWVTGEAWDYTNWIDGEPNQGIDPGGNEDFIHYWGGDQNGWNDLGESEFGGLHSGIPGYGTTEASSICEWESAPRSCSPAPSGLISWWPGDGTAADIAGLNNGTINGNTAFVNGVASKAFSFDGSSNVTVAPTDQLLLGAKPFTMDLWVNFNSLGGRDPFIAHDDGPGYTNKWIFWYDEQATMHGHVTDVDGPALRLHVNNVDGVSADPISYPWSPTPGQWYHVALTRSGNDFTLYLNGEPVKTTQSAIVIPSPQGPLTIGSAELYSLNGLADEVEMYSRALTAEEIKAIYLAGSAGKCKPGSVTIDVKSSVNPKNKGVIPVHLLSSASFSAASVDVASLRFGAPGAGAAPSSSALSDVNGDGKADLVLQFSTQKSGITCGNTSAVLTGKTKDGAAIRGTGAIVTVGCK